MGTRFVDMHHRTVFACSDVSLLGQGGKGKNGKGKNGKGKKGKGWGRQPVCCELCRNRPSLR